MNRGSLDVSCLAACVLVFAAEATALATRRLDVFGDHARLAYYAFGSNGKETTVSTLVIFTLIALLVKQPTAFLGFAAALDRGGRRARCVILLALQTALFALLMYSPTTLHMEALRAVSEGPAIGPASLRLLWQATADAALLMSALAVCDSFKGRSPRAVSAAIVLVFGCLGAGLVSILQPFLMPHIRAATVAAARGLLTPISDLITYAPELRLLGCDSYAAFVGAECSGIESISLMFTSCCLFLIAFRGRLRFPRALVILPIGVSVIWVANVIRLSALMWIGAHISADVATGLFHASAGWVLFDSAAVGLMILCARSPLLGGDFLDGFFIDKTVARYLLPLLVSVFLRFLTPHWGPIDAFFPLRVAVIGTVLWVCWRRWSTESVERPSWQAAAIGAIVFVGWVGGIGSGSLMFNREIAGSLAAMSTPWMISWLVIRAAGTILVTPLVEELAFRGYLARWLVDSDIETVPLSRYTALSFVGSSLAFGFLHNHWIVATFAGMLFAVSAMRRGRLSDAIASHMVANALLVAFALATGRWAVWLP